MTRQSQPFNLSMVPPGQHSASTLPAQPPRLPDDEADDDEGPDELLPLSSVRPLSYDVHLALTGPPSFTTEGVVAITLEVASSISSFLLHASGLTILSAIVHPGGIEASVTQVQTYTKTFNWKLFTCPTSKRDTQGE